MNQKALVEAAFAMLPKAYAPYSHFHVGAALLTKDGEVSVSYTHLDVYKRQEL